MADVTPATMTAPSAQAYAPRKSQGTSTAIVLLEPALTSYGFSQAQAQAVLKAVKEMQDVLKNLGFMS